MPPSTVSVAPVTYAAAGEAQEADAGGDLLAAYRRGGPGSRRRVAVVELRGQLGLDQARRDRVHRDAPARDLDGDRPGQRDQPGLRRSVVGLAGVGAQADDRGDVDDPPEARPHHRAQRPAGEPEGGGEVGVDDPRPSPRRTRRIESPSAVTPALLTSTSTRPSSSSADASRPSAAPGSVTSASIATARPPAPSISPDHPLGALAVGAVVDRDGPAGGGKLGRDRGADPARGAGDQRAALRAPRLRRSRATAAPLD